MSGEETREIRVAFSKMKKVCKIIKAICFVCLVGFVLIWLLLIGLAINEMVSSDQPQTGLKEIAYLILTGLLTISLLIIAIRVFSDIVIGESPFSLKQVKRLRIAGALFLFYAISEALVSFGFSFGTVAMEHNLIVDVNSGDDTSIINVNLSAILISLACFGLAIIFKYGVLLQRLNDETM